MVARASAIGRKKIRASMEPIAVPRVIRLSKAVQTTAEDKKASPALSKVREAPLFCPAGHPAWRPAAPDPLRASFRQHEPVAVRHMRGIRFPFRSLQRICVSFRRRDATASLRPKSGDTAMQDFILFAIVGFLVWRTGGTVRTLVWPTTQRVA